MSTESPDPLARLREAVGAHQANQTAIQAAADKLAQEKAQQSQEAKKK